MDIPYVQQSLKNSCGAASLAMLLAHKGIFVEEQHLIDVLGIVDHGSTSQSALRKVLKSHSLQFQEFAEKVTHKDASQLIESNTIKIVPDSFSLLKSYLDKDIPCLVNFAPDPFGHFSIALAVDEEFIYLHDPSRGAFYE